MTTSEFLALVAITAPLALAGVVAIVRLRRDVDAGIRADEEHDRRSDARDKQTEQLTQTIDRVAGIVQTNSSEIVGIKARAHDDRQRLERIETKLDRLIEMETAKR